MSLFRLALAYLAARPLLTALNILLLSLGVATLALLLLFTDQAEDRLARDARPVDLVVGAKGSPMQLILSSIFHADVPTGNIKLHDAAQLLKNPMIASGTPLALGDSHAGFRIVGTDESYPAMYDAKVSAGRLFKEDMDAVIGADVAKRSGLAVGKQFVGTHGLTQGGSVHGGKPFTVVGILERNGSVLDRLILTPVESVWHVHEEHIPSSSEAAGTVARPPANEAPVAPGTRVSGTASGSSQPTPTPSSPATAVHGDEEDDREITAMLIKYRTPLAAASLPRAINSASGMQAASPAYESARLMNMVGLGVDTLQAFALALMASAALSMFIALTSALQERRYDLALLRALGARRSSLAFLVLAEGVTLLASGVILGLGLGHAGAQWLGSWLGESSQLPLTGLTWAPAETWLVIAVSGAGIATCLLPAFQAYRSDIATTLARR
jgi:putative ABC transport system permease protein